MIKNNTPALIFPLLSLWAASIYFGAELMSMNTPMNEQEEIARFGFEETATQPLDTLSRGAPGYAVVGVTMGSEASPISHLTLIVRPVQGAELGHRVKVGKDRLRQRQVFHEVPRGYVVVGIEAAASGRNLQHLTLEAARLPEGVTLGERVRVGDSRKELYQTQSLGPVAYREVPNGYYLTGLGVATLSGLAGGEGVSHIGLHLQRLVVPLDRASEEMEGTRSIYVSSSEGDDAGDGSRGSPVATLIRAKQIAEDAEDAEAFRILLKGGDVFVPRQTMRGEVMDERNYPRGQFAFLWDIDKPLLLSTYGSTETAVIGPGGYMSDEGPARAIGISAPCRQPIVIENIAFRTWQAEILYVYAYQPAEGGGLVFRNNLVEKQGTYYFPGETLSIDGDKVLPLEDARRPGVYPNVGDTSELRPRDWHPFFIGGTVQLRSSRHIVLRNNIFKDLHGHFYNGNDPLLIENMHAFYIGRSSDILLEQNVVMNASGNPLKFSYEQTRDVDVRNNLLLYTSPSINLGVVQTGWVRLSGGRAHDQDWPAGVRIDGNYFFHPFCWEGVEDCGRGRASKISVNRPVEPSGVEWSRNVFRYEWE